MKKVLFVDDEPNILQGLRRMLRPLRKEWRMFFAEGAMEALAILDEQSIDIVVSDMRMPEYDGAYLLGEVQKRSPGTARIILSGHAEQEMAIRSVAATHQFLAKPCDAETLRETVQRTCQLREMMADPELQRVATELGRLPSVPSIYQAMTTEMSQPEPDIKSVAAIIADDLAMSAKILQLVNSAFFGLRRSVSSIEQAVTYLGLNVIRSLVLSQSAFRIFDDVQGAESVGSLSRRGQQVGTLARAIARNATDNAVMSEEAFQAGMLHELGKLIIASELPAEQRRIDAALRDGSTRADADRAVLRVTHGELGGYLLGLWGLSDGIVEAIAYQAEPSRTALTGFAPVVAVHVAAALVAGAYRNPDFEVDEDWLTGLGFDGQLGEWQQLAEETLDKRNAA